MGFKLGRRDSSGSTAGSSAWRSLFARLARARGPQQPVRIAPPASIVTSRKAFGSHEYPVIGLADLIVNKRASARAQDIAGAEALEWICRNKK